MVATINNSSTSNVNENEEITTIFVVGFPDDITEREFQNIFTFSTGFEAAILKIPSTTNDTDEQYGFGRKQIIGFVKFHTREEAQITKNILTGKKIDQDKHSILKAEFAKKNLHSKRQESKSSAQQASPPHFISQTEPVIQKHNEPPIYNYQRLPATPLSLPKIPVTSCEPIISNTSMYIHSPPVIPSDILYPTEFPELDIQDRFLQQSQQPPSRPSSTSFSFESVFQAGSNNAQTGFQDMYMDMLNLGSEAYTPSSSNVHSRANSANGNHLFALENTNLDFNGSLVSHLHPFTSESFVGKSLLPTNFSAEQGRSLNQHYSSESSHIHQFTHQHPNTLHNAISETITKLPANHSEPENNFLVETYENATFDYPGESQFMSESPPASLEDHPLVHRNQEQQHHNSNRHRQSSNLDWPPFRSIDQNPPCNTLYVGNLPPNTTPEELEILFGKSKGYRRLCFRNRPSGPMCFVEFEDVSAATQVMCEMYGFPLSTHQKGGIRLSYSKNPLGVRLAPTSGVKEDGAFGTNVTHPLLLI